MNKYMDEYLADKHNLSAKAKAEKFAKITAKTIIAIGSSGRRAAAGDSLPFALRASGNQYFVSQFNAKFRESVPTFSL